MFIFLLQSYNVYAVLIIDNFFFKEFLERLMYNLILRDNNIFGENNFFIARIFLKLSEFKYDR